MLAFVRRLCYNDKSGSRRRQSKEDVEMKMKTKLIIAAVSAAAVACIIGGIAIGIKHKNEMTALQTQLELQHDSELKLQEVISDLKSENLSLTNEKESLADQIAELTTEEVIIFNAGVVMDEIKNISELASVEYRYTNVGTLDSARVFTFMKEWKVPFSKKAAIVTMDGVIKAGIDLSQVKIESNENKKTITVTMPESRILSNELDEQSFKVYQEDESVWNQITLTDSKELRDQIKKQAEQNAVENKILEQASDKAEQLVRSIIEATPGIKETYQISFEAAKK